MNAYIYLANHYRYNSVKLEGDLLSIGVFMKNSSLIVLLHEILREKGLARHDAEHFLMLELSHINLYDRLEIRLHVEKHKLCEEEATHKVIETKQRRLYYELFSGQHDRRLSFY
ncbi:hypothetical protein AB4581_11480 [Vibrio cyclitrophicus]